MGGKKQPRTKNNAQPSSSGRHAERLAAGQLIGFSALGDLGYVPAAVGGAPDDVTGGVAISGQLRAVLKKMAKKDAITKSKAVQEFADLCDTHELSDVTATLPFWPRLYRQLATDIDSRVREISQVALHRVLARLRKAATAHMAELMPVWLCSHNDPYPPAASAARRAFQGVFPAAEKQTAAVKFCYSSILTYIKEGLYEITPQAYSDASAMSADEAEARHVRLLTGCLSGLRELIELLPEETETAVEPEQQLSDIITHNRFCKLAKHNHPQVRRWWFCLVSRLCVRRPSLVRSAAGRLVPTAMQALNEQDPAVLTDCWDAAICLVTAVPDCWSLVNLRKVVLPHLWTALRDGGRGCAVNLHPLMIILLSKLPESVAGGDQPAFHQLFFSSMYQGLGVDAVLHSPREVAVIVRSLVECALYVLRAGCTESVTDVIVEQLSAVTNDVIGGGLARVSSHVLPPLAAGLNSLHQLAVSAATPSVVAAQQQYWAATQRAVLREYLPAPDRAAAAVDLLLSAASTGSGSGSGSGPGATSRRVTFSETAPPPPAEATLVPAPAASALALAADSPLRECAARAAQLLMDAARAGSASAPQRRQLTRLLVRVPGVAERVAHRPGSASSAAAEAEAGLVLYETLLVPELAEGRATDVPELTATVYRLCGTHERRQLLLDVTQKGYLPMAVELLRLADPISAADPPLADWALSESLLAAVQAVVNSAPRPGGHDWQHVIQAVPLLLNCHGQTDGSDADPAGCLLAGVTARIVSDGAAGAWRLHQLADVLAPACRSAAVLLDAHAAALRCGGSAAALAPLQARLAALDGADDAALAAQLRGCLCRTGGDGRLRAVTLAWAAQLGAARFCRQLDALLPAGWAAVGRRRAAHLCLLVRRRVSQRRPPDAADAGGVPAAADHLRWLLVQLADWQSSCEAVSTAAARHLPDLLAAHVTQTAADQLDTAADQLDTAADRLSTPAADGDGESQLTRLVTSLSADQLDALLETVTERAVRGEDGVYAAALAVLLRVSSTDESSLVERLQDNMELLLPSLPLLADAALLQLVTTSGCRLERLALVAACLHQLAARHDQDWLLTECGAVLLSLLDAVVRARDAGQLPCSWEEASENWDQLIENASVLYFFDALLQHCWCVLESIHWDMLLLSVSSWVAGLDGRTEPASVAGGDPAPAAAPVLLHALCRTVETVRRAVLRVGADNVQLTAEWDELYCPEWYRSLLVVFATMAAGVSAVTQSEPLLRETLNAVCAAVLNAPAAVLLHHALPVRVDGELDESHLPAEAVTLLSWWRRLLTAPQRCVRMVAGQTMYRFLPYLAEMEQKRPHQEDERGDPKLSLPTIFNTITQQTEPLVAALLSHLESSQTCVVEPSWDSHHVVLTHLQTWHLALTFTSHLDTDRKVMTAEALREDGLLDNLLQQLFALMPESPEVPAAYADTHQSYFQLHPVFDISGPGSVWEVQHWACRTYAELLRQLPVLARAWRSGCERALALRVERLTSEYVSPLLLAEEFAKLQAAERCIDHMTVRARPSVREVSAVYTMEEASTELVVRLPADYPLGHVVADAAGRRVGVAAGQWRKWMLQLTTFLTHQNGSVLSGLLLWKQNIDKRFQGAEECNICFYVLHGTNYQLPKLACRNCKKRFHSACLYKWFNTSSKSTCPMCRQLF